MQRAALTIKSQRQRPFILMGNLMTRCTKIRAQTPGNGRASRRDENRTMASMVTSSTGHQGQQGHGSCNSGASGAGRPRDHATSTPRSHPTSAIHASSSAEPAQRRHQRPSIAPSTRPTHFLSIPIVSQTLHEAYSRLMSRPAFAHLDPLIVIPSANLHLTLGVLHLPTSHAVDAVRQLLHGPCLASIQQHVIAGTPLTVALQGLDVMQQDARNAHVLYAKIAKDANNGILADLCHSVREIMQQAAYMADERKPFKMHVTVANTVYGNKDKTHPRRRPQRIPFDASQILDEHGDATLGPVILDRLHLMRMGRRGPSGTYQSVDSVSLINKSPQDGHDGMK
ncbi:AKAP7 2'5' RNA ligase-like domain-containing protein [Gongronella butleri]|nr:AKAP7 2'5' RNA ligase-like domain-containing protein [Gongronella butleri]